MLSLVSASVLGFDLVRHPHGDAVAAVLLCALSCGPDEVAVFTDAHARVSRVKRNAAWRDVRATDARTIASFGTMLNRDRTCLDDIITELRDRMIVDLGDLEALVREDVFAWCAGAGADAFVDVIASVWPREEVPAGSRRVLAAAFLEGSRSLPWRDLDIGPNADAIRDMLTRLSGAQPALRTSLRAAAATMRYEATGDWSAAMHEASWAALTTGRIRAAAAAQFMAVRAWFTGGFEAMDGAEGLWNMISGCVQANVIADVLADDVAATLNRGWRSVCG